MSDEYDDGILYRAQLLWGEGFLSPGGPEDVALMVEGVALEGTRVLDLGSGLGGADLLLVQAHGAGHVTGIDVEPKLVEGAKALAAKADADDRVEYRLVEPGPLPFDGDAFDVVFTRGALVQIEDKAATLAEMFRVLRPGGQLLMNDWFRGGNLDGSQGVRLFERLGITVRPDTVGERVASVTAAGFVDVTSLDRSEHEAAILADDRERLAGPLRDEVVATVGENAHREGLAVCEIMHSAMATRSICSARLWARKPA